MYELEDQVGRNRARWRVGRMWGDDSTLQRQSGSLLQRPERGRLPNDSAVHEQADAHLLPEYVDLLQLRRDDRLSGRWLL